MARPEKVSKGVWQQKKSVKSKHGAARLVKINESTSFNSLVAPQGSRRGRNAKSLLDAVAGNRRGSIVAGGRRRRSGSRREPPGGSPGAARRAAGPIQIRGPPPGAPKNENTRTNHSPAPSGPLSKPLSGRPPGLPLHLACRFRTAGSGGVVFLELLIRGHSETMNITHIPRARRTHTFSRAHSPATCSIGRVGAD